MKGEAFITNLENVNKHRVENQTNEVPLTKTSKIVGIKKGEDAAQAAAPGQQDDAVLDLNPTKQGRGDNIFLDFMALYSRASHNDKKH